MIETLSSLTVDFDITTIDDIEADMPLGIRNNKSHRRGIINIIGINSQLIPDNCGIKIK